MDCSTSYQTLLKITPLIRRMVAKEIMIQVFYWVVEKEIKTIVLVRKNAVVHVKDRQVYALATMT